LELDGDPIARRPTSRLVFLVAPLTIVLVMANATRVAAMSDMTDPTEQSSSSKTAPMQMMKCDMPGMAGGMMPMQMPSEPSAPCCQSSRDEGMLEDAKKRLKAQEARAGDLDAFEPAV
jgi:hypothetical protein